MKTKELIRVRNISIGIFDKDNFYISKYIRAEKGKNKGNEILASNHMTFYSTLTQAIKAAVTVIAKEKVADGDIDTLHQYIGELDSIWREIRDFTKDSELS